MRRTHPTGNGHNTTQGRSRYQAEEEDGSADGGPCGSRPTSFVRYRPPVMVVTC